MTQPSLANAEGRQDLVGFQFIDTAPHDGSFIRLRFRRVEGEEVGQWKDMPDGFKGWWDRAGNYISPGPLYWAEITNPDAGAS